MKQPHIFGIWKQAAREAGDFAQAFVQEGMAFITEREKGVPRTSVQNQKPPVRDPHNLTRTLTYLSLNNTFHHVGRAVVTIGGVAVGIATVVLLVSLGYGVQNVVVSGITDAESLNHVQVTSPPGSRLVLGDQVLKDLAALPNVESVEPSMAVIGRVRYEEATSELTALAASRKAFEMMNAPITAGRMWDDDVAKQDGDQIDDVATSSAQLDSQMSISQTSPSTLLRIRSAPDSTAQILGYTRDLSDQEVEQVMGGEYIDESGQGRIVQSSDGAWQGIWYKGTYAVWQVSPCTATPCDTPAEPQTDSDGNQLVVEGYVAAIGVEISSTTSTESETTTEVLSSQNTGIRFSSPVKNIPTDRRAFGSETLREVVVNHHYLRILNAQPEEVIGQEVEMSVLIPTALAQDSSLRIESYATPFVIVGVVEWGEVPTFFVPLTTIQSLGVRNASQVTLTIAPVEAATNVVTAVESLGFNATSVQESIAEVEMLFANIRIALFIIGAVAVIIASFGMFNTLTVSLLERTKEVGLLKTMGLTSSEIHRMFLAESLVISLLGGTAGVILGVSTGLVISGIVSAYALTRGGQPIMLTATPLGFVILIFLLSFILGIVTGYLPARRSRNISALEALKY